MASSLAGAAVLPSGCHEQVLPAGIASDSLLGALDEPWTRARFKEVVHTALARQGTS